MTLQRRRLNLVEGGAIATKGTEKVFLAGSVKTGNGSQQAPRNQ
jgi:hypothetical protein